MQEKKSETSRGGRVRRMRRLAISLLKGGVAKSGTAVSLAHGLALAGHKVLLVDSDVQAQCSDMLGVHPRQGLAEVVAGLGDPLSALAEARENLWLLAGGNGLAGVKMEIARREMSPEAVLAEAMEHYEGGFDYLIMDTAPGWDTLLVNALYCCQEVISPVSMEPMALSGLMRFQERLAVIQKYNPQLQLRWIVPTFVDGRVRKTFDILEQLRQRYGDLVGPEIKYTVKLSEAPAFGKTIFEHDPKGVGAKGYLKLAELVAANPPGQTQARTAAVAAGLAPVSANVSERAAPAAPPVNSAAPASLPPQAKPAPPLPAPVAKSEARETAPSALAARLQEAGPPPPQARPPAPAVVPGREAGEQDAGRESASSRILLSARLFLRERLKKPAASEPAPDESFRDIRERYRDGRA